MALSEGALRVIARHIRDALGPLVAREGGEVLSTTNIAELLAFFGDVKKTAMTIEMIRYSRIEKAMMEICGPGTRWPPDLIKRAEDVIDRWERSLGPVKCVKANLWGPNGRLEGVTKVVVGPEAVHCEQQLQIQQLPVKPKAGESSWCVQGGCDPARAYVPGHNGFDVGAWWIKAAAAFRDGMLDDSNDGIIANDDGAYAVVMTDEDEIESGREGVIFYKTPSRDPGRFQLMKNITSRNPIRVLRTWRLKSTWAPEAGIRYDGLYLIHGYGVRLTSSHGRDNWHFTFELRRKSGQPCMEKALLHPTADELDDWKEYHQAKAERRWSDMVSSLFGDSGLDHIKSADSGYLSGNRQGSKH